MPPKHASKDVFASLNIIKQQIVKNVLEGAENVGPIALRNRVAQLTDIEVEHAMLLLDGHHEDLAALPNDGAQLAINLVASLVDLIPTHLYKEV